MAKKTRRKTKGKTKSRRRKKTNWKKILGWLAGLVFFFVLWSKLSPSTFQQFSSWVGMGRHTITNGKYDGIDVSKHQGKINWEKVADDENIKFVYIKATEGATLKDKRYATNIKNARSAGLKVGSYHFFIYRINAQRQFDNFSKRVKKSEQDLIPVVDVEEIGCRNANREKLQQNLKKFMQLVKDEYGHYPIIYSDNNFYNKMLAPQFNKYKLFLARYNEEKPNAKGDAEHIIWQYNEKGYVKGIKGNVDLNRFANGASIDDIEM